MTYTYDDAFFSHIGAANPSPPISPYKTPPHSLSGKWHGRNVSPSPKATLSSSIALDSLDNVYPKENVNPNPTTVPSRRRKRLFESEEPLQEQPIQNQTMPLMEMEIEQPPVEDPILKRQKQDLSTKNPKLMNSKADGSPSDTFCMNGKNYGIQRLANGRFNVVYAFTGQGTMESNGMPLDVSTLVLRIRNHQDGLRDADFKIKNELKNYYELLEAGAPLPPVHITPDKFEDSTDKGNGGFWIVEKMDSMPNPEAWKDITDVSQLNSQNQKILQSVKNLLLINARAKKDLVNDFFPRNVMLDKQGELKVVDFNVGRKKWVNRLYKYTVAWSNGNEYVFHYLISDFEKGLQETMINRLRQHKEENGGAFPLTNQTRLGL